MKFEKKSAILSKKEFKSEPVQNKKYLKAEKNLITKKSTQKKALNKFIYSVYIKDKNNYLQVFLEKYKYYPGTSKLNLSA